VRFCFYTLSRDTLLCVPSVLASFVVTLCFNTLCSDSPCGGTMFVAPYVGTLSFMAHFFVETSVESHFVVATIGVKICCNTLCCDTLF